MGTQLAYGGSGSAPWDAAAADAAAIDGGRAPASGDLDSGPEPDTNIDSLIDHVIDAIEAHETRPIPDASTAYTSASVRPSVYTSGGRSVRSSTSKFVSTPHSGRSAKQAIGRGSAAVAAGNAFIRGDAEALRELGLDLGRLRDLSARERQQMILDEILGAPGHPDDEALRRATHETLKAQAADPMMTQDDQIDFLLGSYVYEQTLVELTSQHARRELSRDALRKLDERLKPAIFKKAKHMASGSGRYLSPALFIEKATGLVEAMLRVMRSER
ncbi:Uncharacterised protein [Mycobacteroides abscessus subsp. abscessus]|uniref:hypothetical protein n=1 Tax=Mycobacteroides abscessus TaxID=36809 RepID=UPI000925FA38|nr:hypothetical protein [Mycobacteroides abscessus]SIK94771.1 Uncharacterised protein [Mycobacteroides abscessus subsp. abscessus]SLC90185.1 Uncharacterised protein [Mycobacteroides abscessus subsp. abscessus]